MQEAISYRSSNWGVSHQLENPIIFPNNVRRIKENSSPPSSSVDYYYTSKRSETEVTEDNDVLKKMVEDNAVIVFGKRGCCMSHVVKRLLQALGSNPAVYDVDEEAENHVVDKLDGIRAGGSEEGRVQFPAVFIGGRWFGGLDRIMATHITGELTPLLKQAGALWL